METPNPNPNPNPDKQPKSSSSSSSSSSHVDDVIESWRNWAELGHDALSLIFEKVGFVEVLTGAQYVCRSWRNVSLEPSLWRLIHIVDGYFHVDMDRVILEAINRAQGHVQCFSAGVFSSDDLFSYLADRNSNLRCLRLFPTNKLSCGGLAEALGRFPLLEELDITYPEDNTRDVFKRVGEACPHLKCLRYNEQGSRSKDVQDDKEAFDIANYMPELRELQIVGNMLTNKGLLVILDKCLHLQSLDLRRCFHVNLNDSVLAKCARIEKLRCPNDATDDCGFIDESDGDFSDDDSYLNDEDTDLHMMNMMDYDYFREDYYDTTDEDEALYSCLAELEYDFTF